MKSTFLLGFVLAVCAFGAAKAEETEEPKEMLRALPWSLDDDMDINLLALGIVDPGNDTNKRIFFGGGHSGGSSESISESDDSESGEADKKYDCDRKLAKANYRVKKCEQAKAKIVDEIQIILKRISKLERQLEYCRSRKTCKEITDSLLGSFAVNVEGAASCVSRAFKASHYTSNSYDSSSSGGYSREL